MSLELVRQLIDTAHASLDEIRARVSNVRNAPIDIHADSDSILFDFDGKPWVGYFRGRNLMLLVGFGEDRDKAIAIRIMLDGDARPISLYQDVKATGGYISNHSSDLYIEVNDINTALLKKHDRRASTFVNQVTGKLCYDVPFAYDPYWDNKPR
jgi:hypothetical protein